MDLDATDVPLHGGQEGRFYHGYYREYCYLPLLVFCGAEPLLVRLRSMPPWTRPPASSATWTRWRTGCARAGRTRA